MKKTVFITGGAKGIGKCLTENLAKEGYQVFINYYHSEKQAKELKEKLVSQGYQVEIGKADVSKEEEVKEVIKKCIFLFEKIDILINNAGIDQVKPFLDITTQDWKTMIDNNLNSVFYITKQVIENMISYKSGCIINISSVFGMVGGSCEVHYSVTKAAIDGMTKALAKEMGPSHIRVNSIAPGLIDTDMNKNLTKEELEEIKNQTPLEKIGKPEDIYRCVKWLIEDEFTTGQIISPNGGWIII